MSIDIRQIGNRNEYTDRCKIYNREAVDGNKLVKDAVAMGIFYKKDIVPFKWVRVIINGILTNNTQYQGTVETVDDVSQLRPNMYVQDENGMLYQVGDEIERVFRSGSKRFSNRPSAITRITLIGME